MKLDNLEVGQVVKNYKELCSLLDIEQKRGKGKDYQTKEIERHIDYEKKGHKFIIKEIYSEPLEKIDARTEGNNVASYIADTELLLIDLLLCAENEEMKIPTNALLEVLKLVNYSYRKYMREKRPLLSKELNMDIRYIDDYYNNVGSMLNGNINTVINRLVRKKLLIHKEIYMLKVVEVYIPENEAGKGKLNIFTSKDDNGNEILEYTAPKVETHEYFKEASTSELRQILKIEREVYKQLGMNENSKLNDLYKNGKKFEFDNIVKRRLLSEMNVRYYFKSHHLIFNHDDVATEKLSILDDVGKNKIEYNVNNEIQFRIIENAEKRASQAKENLQLQYQIHFGNEKEQNDIKGVRLHDDYVSNFSKLTDELIRRSDVDLKNFMQLIEMIIDDEYN